MGGGGGRQKRLFQDTHRPLTYITKGVGVMGHDNCSTYSHSAAQHSTSRQISQPKTSEPAHMRAM
jgi:hypothetical protein